MDFKSTCVHLRPSPSETIWGPQVIKAQTEERKRFLISKEVLLMTEKESFVSLSQLVL